MSTEQKAYAKNELCVTAELEVYANEKEFCDDLIKVFRDDYGVELSRQEACEAGSNLTEFLGKLLFDG